MKNKLRKFFSHNIVLILSMISALIICKASFSNAVINNGLQITNITGGIVLIGALFTAIYYAFLSFNSTLFTRVMFCTGSLLIWLEYTASLFLHINLNQWTSIFWCDCGLIFLLIGIFNLFILYINKALKK